MTPEQLESYANKSEQSAANISARAEELGVTLPSDYAAFLEQYDGVDFQTPWSEGHGFEIEGAPSFFDGLLSLEDIFNIYSGASRDEEEDDEDVFLYKFAHCVVATVNGEELVMVTEEGPHRGRIFHWDNEEGCLMEAPDDFDDDLPEELNQRAANAQVELLIENEIIAEVAPNFTEFLDRITQYEG